MSATPYGTGFLTDLAPLFHLLILIGAPVLLVMKGPWKSGILKLLSGGSNPLRNFFFGPSSSKKTATKGKSKTQKSTATKTTPCPHAATGITPQPQLGKGAGDSTATALLHQQTLLPGEDSAEIRHFDPDFYQR